jgi:hypothetical protein
MNDSSKTSSADTEWTVRSRYETTDGDRVTLLYAPDGSRFAVSYSYEWGNPPQFIEYTDRLNAHKAFSISLQNATRRDVIANAEG